VIVRTSRVVHKRENRTDLHRSDFNPWLNVTPWGATFRQVENDTIVLI
jgi:hypothetical protein